MKKAIIIGAGPAGLTAAYELLKRTDIQPIIIEKSKDIGGLARTVTFKGNRMDVGPHRFFSKSDRVMDWWFGILPLEKTDAPTEISYQNKKRSIEAQNDLQEPKDKDAVMLVRKRKTRIYFLGKLFSYPISLSFDTLKKLGLIRTTKIFFSYVKSALFPVKDEKSLRDFFVNRFGQELYQTFFKSYTEKVWGVSCNEISAEWGAQRVKGLSIKKAMVHFFKEKNPFHSKKLSQKKSETSLVEQFLYPKYGAGHMWEEVAKRIVEKGGEIYFEHKAKTLNTKNGKIESLLVETKNGQKVFEANYFFSTMPIQDLVQSIGERVPAQVSSVCNGLVYRDMIIVGILADTLAIYGPDQKPIKDNWIYIQEPNIHAGRIQFCHNMSPHLVVDTKTFLLGAEYFCFQSDDIWKKSDDEITAMALDEMDAINIVKKKSVLDTFVLRVPKAYPAYFGSYDRFDEIQKYFDAFINLYLIGRNGMHRYNNQDHSMLAAMTAVDNIVSGRGDKSNIWAVNAEQEYHEEKSVNKE